MLLMQNVRLTRHFEIHKTKHSEIFFSVRSKHFYHCMRFVQTPFHTSNLVIYAVKNSTKTSF